MYGLRNEHGILIADIDNQSAGLIMQGSGRWEQRTFKLSGKKNVFVFSGDFSYSFKYDTKQMKVFIWEGYYLEAK